LYAGAEVVRAVAVEADSGTVVEAAVATGYAAEPPEGWELVDAPLKYEALGSERLLAGMWRPIRYTIFSTSP